MAEGMSLVDFGQEVDPEVVLEKIFTAKMAQLSLAKLLGLDVTAPKEEKKAEEKAKSAEQGVLVLEQPLTVVQNGLKVSFCVLSTIFKYLSTIYTFATKTKCQMSRIHSLWAYLYLVSTQNLQMGIGNLTSTLPSATRCTRYRNFTSAIPHASSR